MLFSLSVASRTQSRQTCMFQVPAPVPAPAVSSESPSAVLTNCGWLVFSVFSNVVVLVQYVIPHIKQKKKICHLKELKSILPPYPVIPDQQRRKNESKLTSSLSLVRESLKENSEPEKNAPPAAKGKLHKSAHKRRFIHWEQGITNLK